MALYKQKGYACPEDTRKERDVLDCARRNIDNWYTYFSENYQDGRYSKQFLLADMWDTEDKEDLIRLGIPILSFNRLYDFTKKIIGSYRDKTPNLQIRSKEYNSSQINQKNHGVQQTVDLLQNLVRGIAYDSKSQVQYQNTFTDTIQTGYGAIRICHEYENALSFNQRIYVEHIPVPEQAFFDPSAQKPTKEDGHFCGTYVTMSLDTFKQMYPDIKSPQSYPDQSPTSYFSWGDRNSISVVDYYEKVWFKIDLLFLEDGQTMTRPAYEEYTKKILEIDPDFPVPIIENSRKSDDYKIVKYRMIYNNVLDRREFPSHVMPVIFADGDSYTLDGEQRTQAFITHAIDAQRFLNYAGVAIAQSIKNSRREQFIATADNVRGYEKQWTNPEQWKGTLLYNPDKVTKGGPVKLPPSEVPQTLMQNYERAATDIQNILGFFNANLGGPTREISGIAINSKIRQGNTSVAVYEDNMLRVVEQVGRCVLDMIPRIYDTERNVGILLADGKTETAMINERQSDGTVENDLTKGSFDIQVQAGESFGIQKENALNALLEMIKVDPRLMPLIADLIADNLDIENRPQLVERFKTLVPPKILALEKGLPPEPEKPQPPQITPEMIEMVANKVLELKQIKLKEDELGVKTKDQQLHAFQALLKYRSDMTADEQKKLESIAEMHKAGVDYRGELLAAYVKILKKDEPKEPTERF